MSLLQYCHSGSMSESLQVCLQQTVPLTPLANTLAIDREMFSGCVDVGFVVALPFHHRDLEPDCVGVSTRGGGGGELMRGIKIPLQDFVLKMQGGLMHESGRICGTVRY